MRDDRDSGLVGAAEVRSGDGRSVKLGDRPCNENQRIQSTLATASALADNLNLLDNTSAITASKLNRAFLGLLRFTARITTGANTDGKFQLFRRSTRLFVVEIALNFLLACGC